MTEVQAYLIEKRIEALALGPGQVLAAAREAAENGALVHLGQLTAGQADSLIWGLEKMGSAPSVNLMSPSPFLGFYEAQASEVIA